MFDLKTSRQHCVTELEKLLDRCLPGGYEEHFVENRSGEEDVSTTFAGIELHGKLHRPQRRRHFCHLYPLTLLLHIMCLTLCVIYCRYDV